MDAVVRARHRKKRVGRWEGGSGRCGRPWGAGSDLDVEHLASAIHAVFLVHAVRAEGAAVGRVDRVLRSLESVGGAAVGAVVMNCNPFTRGLAMMEVVKKETAEDASAGPCYMCEGQTLKPRDVLRQARCLVEFQKGCNRK